ncbi:MAG: helix-turn-helix domain-containing protein [Alphaproteobacteria bacterium]|nr:helix-turn-helix domain-containing protein [Alphaproteobacteria bacterium]
MKSQTAKKAKPGTAGNHDVEIGRRIRLRRIELKISQGELGERLGVSFQQVQKYEKGVNRVVAGRLRQIAAALSVPVTFFYEGNDRERQADSLRFMDSAFSLRLLRAYRKIRNHAIQRQLVALVELIGGTEED